MDHRTLGATGMSVSEYALGTMMLGSMGNPDHGECVRIINVALDSGINVIDTADVYSGGESEVIVGKALKGRRDDVILATKFGFPSTEDPNRRGASRRWIKRAVEASLRRLDTDYIDLYQLHRFDHATDLDETLDALSDLVTEGKVNAIGSSTFSAERIVEAQWTAREGGHRRFLTEQPRYSLLTRSLEAAVLPTVRRYDMGVLTYGPLNNGWLSGRSDPTAGHRNSGAAARTFDLSLPPNRRKLDAVRKIGDVAAAAGISMPHLATAFVLNHPAVTSVLIGPRTLAHLESSLAGVDTELSADVLDALDDIVVPGADVNSEDNYYADDPALADASQRRR